MLFHTVDRIPLTVFRNEAHLVVDNWDDYTYKSLFQLFVSDERGGVVEIGSVKIGKFGMGDEGGRVSLPEKFSSLPDEYFSLGQDISYYENLNKLDSHRRDQILAALRDTASDTDLYERAFHEKVFQTSLLRSVDPVTAEVQFRRVIRRDAKTVAYRFVFSKIGLAAENGVDGIEFAVSPNSNPPTNIHVLIGSNGSGKTRTLSDLAHSLTMNPADLHPSTRIVLSGDSKRFAGLVTVSFSAFDRNSLSAESLTSNVGKGFEKGNQGIRSQSIGLHKSIVDIGTSHSALKSSDDLSEEFAKSLAQCISTGREQRWIDTISFLLSDPLLDELQLESLVSPTTQGSHAREVFDELSSGHKIVLLTVTRLVELVQERTLVLMDEPETHLHPPLLSAFINALSYLLTETNGVAVAATHSPVILQEVPKSCVWIMNRSGEQVVARRPSQETFAENVGELTHEVFSLEVTESGYHAYLERAASQVSDYPALIRFFSDQLGREGRAIGRSLVSRPTLKRES